MERTIRKGNTGETVKKCQRLLQQLGYDLGICGIDGDYGTATEKAVRDFQKDHKLKADGICGPETWTALEKAAAAGEQPAKQTTYTVTIEGLSETDAKALVAKYKKATMTAEKG